MKAYQFKSLRKFNEKLNTLSNKKTNFRPISDLWLEFKKVGKINWDAPRYIKIS